MHGRLFLAFLLAHAVAPGPGLAQTGASAPAAVEAIKSALQKGDLDGAVSAGEKAAAASPEDALVQTWLGRAYGRKAQSASVFSRLSFAKKCRAAFEKAVALDPANVEARSDLMSFHLQAPGIAGGDKDVARKQADEILRLDPIRGHLAWAAVWEEAKEPARAEAEYRKAIEADPRQLGGRSAFSGFLLNRKRAPDARELWLQFSKANPDQTYGHYALARISLLTGEDLAGGVEHLKIYLATPPRPDTPTWADAHWRLSNIYEKMGRNDEAKAELKEALRLNADHASAKKDLKRLEG
jgi:tetratricopeptide (TPR) repeat protein